MHAGARLGSQWTARRKPCVQGPLRRAHPASGATWNVQVVRGKVTSKCLWHACRALSLGLLLMVLGAAMATIGYYADHLSIGQELRGNVSVRVKNESRGFHLNNLSYAGPIVMGVGGFIVVAACVMTFEARDSAAKVMPARLKGTITTIQTRQTAQARRSAASQTGPTRWDHHLGVFRSSPTSADRRALTAAFLQFSHHLSENRVIGPSHRTSSQRPLLAAGSLSPANPKRSILRCGSVPNLESNGRKVAPAPLRVPQKKPTLRSGCALLNPAILPRQALSVDESHVRYSRESLAGSQGSMAMDLHLPTDGPVTLRVRDRSRTTPRTSRSVMRSLTARSDTARKHMLARQKQIRDDEEHHAQNTERNRDTHSCSPRLPSCQRMSTQDSTGSAVSDYRRSSNTSDTIHTRRARSRDIGEKTRSASTSPHPRRSYQKPPASLDLNPSFPISENDPCDMSPDLITSEYHTVCEDNGASMTSNSRKNPLSSGDSRDSRYSTETGTLHTAAEMITSEDSVTDYDMQTETISTHTEIEDDLTDDITPTFDSDIISSKDDDNDASTVIDVGSTKDSMCSLATNVE